MQAAHLRQQAGFSNVSAVGKHDGGLGILPLSTLVAIPRGKQQDRDSFHQCPRRYGWLSDFQLDFALDDAVGRTWRPGARPHPPVRTVPTTSALSRLGRAPSAYLHSVLMAAGHPLPPCPSPNGQFALDPAGRHRLICAVSQRGAEAQRLWQRQKPTWLIHSQAMNSCSQTLSSPGVKCWE